LPDAGDPDGASLDPLIAKSVPLDVFAGFAVNPSIFARRRQSELSRDEKMPLRYLLLAESSRLSDVFAGSSPAAAAISYHLRASL
jgi:hypothetical protein